MKFNNSGRFIWGLKLKYGRWNAAGKPEDGAINKTGCVPANVLARGYMWLCVGDEREQLYLSFLFFFPHTHLALIKLLAWSGMACSANRHPPSQTKAVFSESASSCEGERKKIHKPCSHGALPLMLMPRTTCSAVVIGGTGGQHLCTTRHGPSNDFKCSYKNLPKTAHRGPLSLQTSC